MSDDDVWKDAEVIYAYTRAQAIEDGVLTDLMQPETLELVQNAGIRFPMAMTTTAFERFVWPAENAAAEAWLRRHGQDPKGRLWDVLWMFRMSARDNPGDRIVFKLALMDWQTRRRRIETLQAVIGPGDNGEPVITIMLPEED